MAINDLVLEGYVNSFGETRGLSHLSEGELFEAFATSSILRKMHQWDVTDLVESVLVGGGGDGGIDAIAILVNGRPVRTEEDIKFFEEKLRRLDVEFVFIQAKSSSRFQAKEIGNFLFGVEQFFSEALQSTSNVTFKDEVQERIALVSYIYKQSIRMQANPRCYAYYAASGKWSGAEDLVGRLDAGRVQLENLQIFSSVYAGAVDADKLKSVFRDLERSVVRDVELSRTAVFPRIDGVDDAYIGLLRGDEFIRLIATDDGELSRELFFDNVRDFQGHNPVNTDIGNTLTDDQSRHSFPLLNNGITITARSINRRGDTFTISDFQIVNGCQTTHMLFQNKDRIGPDIFVPVKLVATTESQIVNEVIKATNRQTAVLPEALESLTPFHKELEDFYNMQERKINQSDRVYYERRSKQFLLDNIDPRNIVSLTGQIKSFIGMFLNEPHSHPRYYGELLHSYSDRLFVQDHRPEPYYASGVALLTLERFLNASSNEKPYRPYKHQLLMILRVLICGSDVPNLNSKDISTYSLRIVNFLRDPARVRTLYSDAKEFLQRGLRDFGAESGVRQHQSQRNPPHRLRAFTELLSRSLRDRGVRQDRDRGFVDPRVGEDEFGRILWYDDWKNFGFIERDGGDRIFVHGGEMVSIPWHFRVDGTRVKYTVMESTKYPGKVMAGGVLLEGK